MVTLLICLCMGSLVALPVDNLAGIAGLEFFGIEIENDNRFEHAESDEGGLAGILRGYERWFSAIEITIDKPGLPRSPPQPPFRPLPNTHNLIVALLWRYTAVYGYCDLLPCAD